MSIPVKYLDTQLDFNNEIALLKDAQWIGFDTEFVGEKSFIPVLCLLQIVWEHGILLVDTLRISDLSGFLNIVADPGVLIITHAGDNDYRLLNTLFNTIPKNLFDTQIAAGFVGYNYPAGFGKIVERELGVSLSKSHTVADWEARPLDQKSISYAIEDVKYLPALYKKLQAKLDKKKRGEWPREELSKWESTGFYVSDPYKEALSSDFIYQLDRKEQVFLLRIYAWRRNRALELNIPKEQVVQGKHISSIMRTLKDGGGSIRANRTIPENAWKKYQADWLNLWKAPVEQFEIDLINNLPGAPPDDPEWEWHYELLYHFVKKQCISHEISAALLFPRGDFNKLKNGNPDFDASMLDGWRATILGKDLVSWLKTGDPLQLSWQPNGGLLVRSLANNP
jgi:ribonuclease D